MNSRLKEGLYWGDETRKWENHAFICNITRYNAETLIHDHFHENDYLSLLVRGDYFERNITEDTLIKNGNIIFRPAYYSHSNNFLLNGGVCFNIEFKQNWRQQFDFNFNTPGVKTTYQTGAFPALYRLLQYFINGNNKELYDELILDWLTGSDETVVIKSSLPWLQKVKAILDNEIEISHSINSISARVHVHPVYLARAFKNKTGATIGEYQLKNKLKKSVSLLFGTNLPINEVAFAAGFYDAPHFINTFNMVYHVSPAKFRSLLKS